MCLCFNSSSQKFGSMKSQLLVSAFNENLWLNLSRACTNSAVLLSIKSGGNKIIPPQLDLFESLECMPQELVPAKNYEHMTDFKGDRKAIMMYTSPTFSYSGFLTNTSEFPKMFQRKCSMWQRQSLVWLSAVCHKSAQQITFPNLVPL